LPSRWRDHVGAWIDGQHLHDCQRQGNLAAREEHHNKRYSFRHVAVEDVDGELADIGVDGPPLFDGADDGSKVVIGKDHVGGFFGDVSAGNAHGDANIGFLQGRGVIDPIR
jgi:hypothetical protein